MCFGLFNFSNIVLKIQINNKMQRVERATTSPMRFWLFNANGVFLQTHINILDSDENRADISVFEIKYAF